MADWFLGAHDQPFCAIDIRSTVYDEDEPRVISNPCGAAIHAVFSMVGPIGPRFEYRNPSDAAEGAISYAWTVECENGHVHRVSSNAHTAADYAEPLDFDAEFPQGLSDRPRVAEGDG